MSADAIKNIIEISKVVLAAIGAIYVALQYNEAIRREQSNFAQAWITRYNEDEIGEARIALSAFWLSDEGQKVIEDEANFVKNVTESLKNQQRLKHFLRVHYFLNDLSVCGLRGICEPSMLCAFFTRDLVTRRYTFSDFYQHWEVEWGEDLLININRFLETHCPCDLAARYCSIGKQHPNCVKYTNICSQARTCDYEMVY